MTGDGRIDVLLIHGLHTAAPIWNPDCAYDVFGRAAETGALKVLLTAAG